MRKIITTTFVTLDGVMQAPGGPDEDTSGGFKYGGWQMGFPPDEKLNAILGGFFQIPFELLLGKTTYDIFAGFWPTAKTDLEVANPFNATKKYVVSHESFEPSWNNSVCISGDDVAAQIQKLKEEDGSDLWVWGSGNLIQTLLENHLVDRMHLWIHPITLGQGKKLFAEGTQAQNWKMTDSKIGDNGLIFATYEPGGEIKTGDAATK
jgi:dihydrofolate reductase